MSQQAAAPMSLVRVSVVSEDRRLDVGVPGSVPLVEVIPGFARSLGVLDPSLVHGGYALRRADGGELDPSLSATAQGVHDGDVLTLARGGLLFEPRVYDDITEAVIDATAEQHRAWAPADSARTALAVSLTFLALCAVLLFSIGPSVLLAPVLAGGGAAVLLIASAVLARLGQVEAGHGFGLAAAVFAGLAGFLALDADLRWGWPLAAAGGAAALTGALAMVLSTTRREVHLVSIVWGIVIAIPATMTGLAPGAAVAAFAMTVAVAAALGNLLPWLAFSSTRLKVISPQSDQEIFAEPTPIDADAVKARAASGARVLVALRLGIGLAVLVATPIVAASGLAGACLAALAFLGMMFQSRQAYARAAVMVVMAVGAVGLALTALTVAASQAHRQGALLVILLGATAILVTVTLLSPRARIGMARAADTVEVIVLTLLLPLGVLAAGWA
ncbi:EsaB/YukD family protein [Demequina sp.]|uniref:EsaB/YukD family protein n=1 Tax=Demequina sp. TaxID=2050685 RepID=UPI003A8BD17A